MQAFAAALHEIVPVEGRGLTAHGAPTFALSSSNQLRTTLICVGIARRIEELHQESPPIRRDGESSLERAPSGGSADLEELPRIPDGEHAARRGHAGDQEGVAPSVDDFSSRRETTWERSRPRWKPPGSRRAARTVARRLRRVRSRRRRTRRAAVRRELAADLAAGCATRNGITVPSGASVQRSAPGFPFERSLKRSVPSGAKESGNWFPFRTSTRFAAHRPRERRRSPSLRSAFDPKTTCVPSRLQTG